MGVCVDPKPLKWLQVGPDRGRWMKIITSIGLIESFSVTWLKKACSIWPIHDLTRAHTEGG